MAAGATTEVVGAGASSSFDTGCAASGWEEQADSASSRQAGSRRRSMIVSWRENVAWYRSGGTGIPDRLHMRPRQAWVIVAFPSLRHVHGPAVDACRSAPSRR